MSAITLPIGVSLGSSVMPAPLSPDDFGNTSQPSTIATQTDMTLTPSNVETLRGALTILKAARADAGSGDPKVAAAAKTRLAGLVAYLTGFADSRGWLVVEPVSSGLESLFGAYAAPSLDETLDDLQSSLESMLAGIDSRSLLKKVLGTLISALGDVAIAVGGGLIATGIAI